MTSPALSSAVRKIQSIGGACCARPRLTLNPAARATRTTTVTIRRRMSRTLALRGTSGILPGDDTASLRRQRSVPLRRTAGDLRLPTLRRAGPHPAPIEQEVLMSLSYKVAITTAVAYSAMSLYDAMYHGVTGRGSAFSDEGGVTWATVAGGALSTIAFAVLAVALVAARAQVDRGSTYRRRLRQLLIVDFGALAGVSAVVTMSVVHRNSLAETILGIVAGVAFGAMFLLSFLLGLSIVRIPELRASAVLLIAVVPLIGLTLAVEALASSFAHPAYAET